MQHRSVERIAGEADVLPLASLSPRERLERWAEVLERHPARLRAIPEVEQGGRRAREARRVDQSPLTVAYADPVLRAAGLRGDTIGDAAGFFGLSQAQCITWSAAATTGRRWSRRSPRRSCGR
jgi:hypothetical protein